VADLAPNLVYPPPTFVRSTTPLTLKWRLVQNPTVSMAQLHKQNTRLSPSILNNTPDDHLLFFWTSSATFELFYPDDEDINQGKKEGERDTKNENKVPERPGKEKKQREIGPYIAWRQAEQYSYLAKRQPIIRDQFKNPVGDFQSYLDDKIVATRPASTSSLLSEDARF